MEVRQNAEAVVRNTVAVARFVGERALGGAYAQLAEIVHPTTPDNIIKGEE